MTRDPPTHPHRQSQTTKPGGNLPHRHPPCAHAANPDRRADSPTPSATSPKNARRSASNRRGPRGPRSSRGTKPEPDTHTNPINPRALQSTPKPKAPPAGRLREQGGSAAWLGLSLLVGWVRSGAPFACPRRQPGTCRECNRRWFPWMVNFVFAGCTPGRTTGRASPARRREHPTSARRVCAALRAQSATRGEILPRIHNYHPRSSTLPRERTAPSPEFPEIPLDFLSGNPPKPRLLSVPPIKL